MVLTVAVVALVTAHIAVDIVYKRKRETVKERVREGESKKRAV